MMAEVDRAHALAGDLLREDLPRRWAHTQGVAACARGLAPLVGERAGILEAAAVLHDIGYAPPLVDTGFHPLDGARYLRDAHAADDRVVRLVANHSFALLEAEEILGRYGEDSVVGRFVRRAAPRIHGSVERVRAAAVEVGLAL
ncbi:metal-dependent phosphohydrolase HD sub domain-containing protein [Actinobacteria bacterium OK074]|nr:metal-dependent phosphohydrolase HD sub domain-containing protein [Actinobacteria bacterium OK074]